MRNTRCRNRTQRSNISFYRNQSAWKILTTPRAINHIILLARGRGSERRHLTGAPLPIIFFFFSQEKRTNHHILARAGKRLHTMCKATHTTSRHLIHSGQPPPVQTSSDGTIGHGLAAVRRVDRPRNTFHHRTYAAITPASAVPAANSHHSGQRSQVI